MDVTVPLAVPHDVAQDTVIDGYSVRKGTMAVFNLDSVHKDKSYWGPDAELFRPERWIDDEGQLKTFDGYIPFGAGEKLVIVSWMLAWVGSSISCNLLSDHNRRVANIFAAISAI